MKESDYQKKISDDLTEGGYFVTNLIKTNRNGIPDLLALKINEPPLYIECKTPKGKLSKIQEFRLDELTGYGFNCYVSYGMELIKWKKRITNNCEYGF
jgi:Holliday junction resolvase